MQAIKMHYIETHCVQFLFSVVYKSWTKRMALRIGVLQRRPRDAKVTLIPRLSNRLV